MSPSATTCVNSPVGVGDRLKVTSFVPVNRLNGWNCPGLTWAEHSLYPSTQQIPWLSLQTATEGLSVLEIGVGGCSEAPSTSEVNTNSSISAPELQINDFIAGAVIDVHEGVEWHISPLKQGRHTGQWAGS